jgi:glutathione S-transferase
VLVRRIGRRYAAWELRPAALGHFEERMRENLGTLSTLLEGKPYLGRGPTIADVAVFAQLAWMQRYAERRLLDDAPTARRWLDTLAAVPAVAAALAS